VKILREMAKAAKIHTGIGFDKPWVFIQNREAAKENAIKKEFDDQESCAFWGKWLTRRCL
jgi:hypothetical protein